jgi:hypothetical protein
MDKNNSNRGEHSLNENYEVSMVVSSNAIIYPWAVVIEPLDTTIANGTMFAASCSDGKTVSA